MGGERKSSLALVLLAYPPATGASHCPLLVSLSLLSCAMDKREGREKEGRYSTAAPGVVQRLASACALCRRCGPNLPGAHEPSRRERELVVSSAQLSSSANGFEVAVDFFL